MSDAGDLGRFVWYDLMTTDREAAVAFYTRVIGWGTTKWEGPTDYAMWTNGGAPLGGVVTLSADDRASGVPPHWQAFIATPATDATVARAGELGARVIVPPTDIPSVGRFAVLADPQGVTFAVFTGDGASPGHEGPPEEREFSWHELLTTDHEAAFAFYSDLFEWEKLQAMDMGPDGTYQIYGRHGQMLGGMFNRPAAMPMPPAWIYYVRVDDVDRVIGEVEAAGGQVLNGPMDVPGGDRVAQCMDPQGAVFAIHQSAAGQTG